MAHRHAAGKRHGKNRGTDFSGAIFFDGTDSPLCGRIHPARYPRRAGTDHRGAFSPEICAVSKKWKQRREPPRPEYAVRKLPRIFPKENYRFPSPFKKTNAVYQPCSNRRRQKNFSSIRGMRSCGVIRESEAVRRSSFSFIMPRISGIGKTIQ